MDASMILTHLICIGQVKNLSSSTSTFDIAQFFSSLNHQLLPLILDKASFDSKVSSFFHDYLVSRRTRYLWNNFSSSSFNVNVGIGQSSALFPILSGKKIQKSKNPDFYLIICRQWSFHHLEQIFGCFKLSSFLWLSYYVLSSQTILAHH